MPYSPPRPTKGKEGSLLSSRTRPSKRRREESKLPRPDPPPPPPASLVRLIQKDAAVLEYFQALQSNLDFDVQKWKSRARSFEQEREILQKEVTQLKAQPQPKSGQVASPRNERSAASERSNTAEESSQLDTPKIYGTTCTQESKALPLSKDAEKGNASEDFELEFSSSSSSEDDEEQDKPKAAMTVKQKTAKSSFGMYKKNYSALNPSLSSSSSSEDDDEEINAIPNSRLKASRAAAGEVLQPQALSADAQLAVDHLKMVFQTLEELGIRLVEKEIVDPSPSTSDKLETTSEPPPNPPVEHVDSGEEETAVLEEEESPQDIIPNTRYILRRRSDQDVAIDILLFIKALTRIKHISKNNDKDKDDHDHEGNRQKSSEFPYYYPFMTDDCLPCYMNLPWTSSSLTNPVCHPAVSGVEKLLMCLCYMDVFCPGLDRLPSPQGQTMNEMTVEEDNSNVNEVDSNLQQLLVAMKGRQIVVLSLLQSLEGEIVNTWASQDRSTRLVTNATHYSMESNQNENDDDHAEPNDLETGQELILPQASIIPFGPKNFARLSGLVERCVLAKIVATIYMFRHDPQKAFQFVWSYLLSTTPSLNLEDHPKLQPVQSFCVLEAILASSVPEHPGAPTVTTKPTLLDWITSSGFLDSKVQRVLGLVLESTAQIYRIRSGKHVDDRISDISRVELAAHARLMDQGCRRWGPVESTENISGAITKHLQEMLSDDGERDQVQTSVATTLVLLLQGDAVKVDGVFDRALSDLKENVGNVKVACRLQERLLACISSKKQLEIRRLDDYRRVVNTPMVFAPNRTGSQHIPDYSKSFVDWLVLQDFDRVSSVVVSAFRCCQTCADAESTFRLVQWITTARLPHAGSDIDPSLFSILDTVETMGQTLTVRVINLERRPDRLAAFWTQALGEGLMVLKGVSAMGEQDPTEDVDDQPKDLLYFGKFAFDGKGKAAEVERRLLRTVGGKQDTLNALVETHWVPNELKPFDSEAPDSDKKVVISPSEKACALSHISGWRGVEQSLSSVAFDGTGSLLRNPVELRQQFLVSGFARGASLFPANDGMPPSPVCVILEDDALLVDRFRDRLLTLLEELPRDFHFCSLGYSRPKTAPLVPFSSQLGIPTSIWYLTGYILSLEGARYLLNKLPVRGPVDSWIGLAMFSNNWDNVFGHAMGVGVSARPTQDPFISKDDLKKILRFRAFAATIPLCSQRVGNLADLPSTRRSWRQRDTDIVYSGNS
jgi:hypothetical protein